MANIQIKTMTTSTPDVIAYQIGEKTMIVQCPHCQKQHTHGIAGGLGHRAADCGTLYSYEITQIKPYEKSTFKNREKSRTK